MPGGFLGLLALGLGRVAAGVLPGPGVGLDLGVGPQKRAGDLVGVDPDRQVKRVVDDVLGQVEAQVEHVVAAGPPGADAVGRVGRAVAADGVLLDQLQHLLAEGQGGVAADPIPRERDASVQEAHVDLLLGSRPGGSIGTDRARNTGQVIITSATCDSALQHLGSSATARACQ